MLGKVGRADTATDPAPLSMLETTIRLKDPAEWRPGMTNDKLVDEMNQAIQFPLVELQSEPRKTDEQAEIVGVGFKALGHSIGRILIGLANILGRAGAESTGFAEAEPYHVVGVVQLERSLELGAEGDV